VFLSSASQGEKEVVLAWGSGKYPVYLYMADQIGILYSVRLTSKDMHVSARTPRDGNHSPCILMFHF
jgi:hypothetical protein